jgi:tetratricopeptide (TPR) repeat protein
LGLLYSVSEPGSALGEFLLASSLDPEYDPAVDTMRTTLNLASLEPDDSRRMIVIGRGLGLLNEWALADEAFKKAVAEDRANAEAWAWLGEAEQQLGRDGIVELDRALSLDPENPIVRSLRGLYWMRLDRADLALEEYLLAAGLEPDNPTWQVSVGEAYSQSGDLLAALSSYLRAVEIAPNDGTYWRLMAEFCVQHGMQVEEYGLPAAQMAVELDGEDPLALTTLGWALMAVGRDNEAQDVLERALSLDPGLARAHLHLGALALQQGDWETARDHLQQARDLDKVGTVGEQAGTLLDQYFP